MTPKDLSTELSKGKFRPVYYFFGSEDFRMIEAEKFLARQFLPDRQMAVNYRRIDGRRTSCADLLAELSVYPMLGEKQVVTVSDFQSYKPTEITRVLSLLKTPDPNRIIILNTPAARTPKKKSAFFKQISEFAEAVEFGKLSAADTSKTIVGKLTRAELTIDPPALQLLLELIAGNRGALEVEVAKLIDFKRPGEKVTVEDVHQVAAGYQVYSVFELAEDILAGDKLKVLRSLGRLVAEGNNPTGLLFFVGQHFVSLYLVKGGKPLEANRRWLTQKFREQASGYSLEQLEQMILTVAETDRELRHQAANPRLVLETMVLRLMDIRRGEDG